MIRLLFVLTGVWFISLPAVAAAPLWLVVGTSDSSPAAIAGNARVLSASFASGIIFQTRDCGNRSNVFGFATFIAASKRAAGEKLAITRQTIKDAYIKRCAVVPGSLLALRIPAVDHSISDVPVNAVNWSDRDRISSSIRLTDGWSLVIIRYYKNAPNDPLEGRRERVLIAKSAAKRIELDDNCPDAGTASVRRGRIALQCAAQQAGNYILHSVLVYDLGGTMLMNINNCRNPKWVSDTAIQCNTESVSADGKLTLTVKKTVLEK